VTRWLLPLLCCCAPTVWAQANEWGAFPSRAPARPDAGVTRRDEGPPPAPPPPRLPDAGAADEFGAFPVAAPPPQPLLAPQLLPAPDAGTPYAAPLPPSKKPTPKQEAPGAVVLRGGVELGGAAWPASPEAPRFEALGEARPLVSLDAGEDFGLELGATFRMLIYGQRDERWVGGVLRRADWDEGSDFGQIIRMLRVAKPEGPFWVKGGAVRAMTLGQGHLLARYSNQENPNYHPTSIGLGTHVGPFRGEFFASDLFGARLFAGDLQLDVGSLFGVNDRVLFAGELAHDAGIAAGPTPPATLFHLDASFVLLRAERVRLTALLAFGGRIQGPAFGALLGLAVDSTLDAVVLGARLELRKQANGFRQGFFGAGYELSRFADTGFRGPGQADAQLPDAFSVALEAKADFAGRVFLEAAVEPYTFGRLDFDARFGVAIFDKWFNLGLRAGGMGLLTPSVRYTVSADLRVRLFPSFYLYAQGGNLYFPQSDGTLFRGAFGGAGLGFDFEKRFGG
jgi:hypothetical protein